MLRLSRVSTTGAANSIQTLPSLQDEIALENYETPLKTSHSLSFSRSERKLATMAALHPLKIPNIIVKKDPKEVIVSKIEEEDQVQKAESMMTFTRKNQR